MSPHAEYSQRLAQWETRRSHWDAMHQRLGRVRLAVGLLVAGTAWVVARGYGLPWYWLLVPLGGFVGVVLYHASVRRHRALASRAVSFYRRGVDRLEGRWAGAGSAGERFDDPHHVYSADLDLFGRGGLFELLCAARTRMGENTLAQWLLEPADLAEIRARQEAVQDLRERLDLRESVATLLGKETAGVEPQALLAWAESRNVLQSAWIHWAARTLPWLCAASTVVWAVWGTVIPFIAILLVEIAVLNRLRGPLAEVLDSMERAFDDLKLFAALLRRIESEPVKASALQQLVEGLASSGLSAAGAIERLSTLAELAGARENLVVKILSVPLLYSVQVTFAVQRWRTAHGSKVRAWIDRVGRYEALVSLAQYGFEHPEDPLPQFLEQPRALFQAHALGHPLMAPASCVRNDVSLSPPTGVLLVSGSNMSGKSTLLRAVGLNAVLAMAGAPVRAQSLQLSALQVGASIRINDSLAEGRSRFYAEIVRLRRLFDLAAGARPMLFLLDEVLQGTNSKDRRIGAQALVRAFVQHNAIGLVSTHDLALTEIGGLERDVLRNVHFQDEVREGEMVFDFKLRDGVVEKSNGLELMRAIGLDV